MTDRADPGAPGRVRLGRAGFASGADVYERARPGYTSETVAHLVAGTGVGPGATVLDLAAGTGKLTRALVPTGAALVAAEPSASMRAAFRTAVPAVPVLAATAEQLPFADGSFDAAVVAQAFHWFDVPEALAELARVLRPGGGLGLVWNERDGSDPVVARLDRVSRWERDAPYQVGTDFGAVVDASGLFGPVTRARFRFTQSLTREAFVEQVASRSTVAVLPDDARRELLAGVAELAASLPEPIRLPYLVDTFCTRSLGPVGS